MSFKWKLAVNIFLVGLLPALLVIGISAYMLNSTLNRVASTGMETSLQAASALVDQTQQAAEHLLAEKLPDRFPWHNPVESRNWPESNNVDLAYSFALDGSGFAVRLTTPESSYVDSGFKLENFPPGYYHLEIEDRYYLIYTKRDKDFDSYYGCGILMPSGYGDLGRGLAGSISASASLGMYKAFSLKLLAMITLLAVGLALGISLIVSTLISRQLVRPLEVLSRGARIVGSGDLGHRVAVQGGDEFSELAGSFNRMAGEISENQRRLLEAERLAAWREVARRIAHEIRNPLTPINIELFRLSERLLRASDGTPDKALKSLEAIRAQIAVLQELATQFSTFAREPELKLVSCSLVDVVRRTAALFEGEREVWISLDLPVDLPPLQLDPQMMMRAISNLIKNSLEASPSGARVDIKATAGEGAVMLTLRDSGPGFPEEKLLNIDKPYITTKRSGTGLGLVIVKKIVEEHGGRVHFYNDGGAVVKMIFPVA